MKILLVRLGALGDLVHALPALAMLRAAHPEARLDWLVEPKHRALLDLAGGIDAIVPIDPRAMRNAAAVMARLRRERYDVAIDLQGLLKSAVLARLSGAARVAGFARAHLREGTAAVFYTETHDPGRPGHVMAKNRSLVAAVVGGPREGATIGRLLEVPESGIVAEVRARLGAASDARFAVLNPGAGWPNKRWPPDRFGALAARLRERRGWQSAVVWGPGEEPLAEAVVAASEGAAVMAPPTDLRALVAILGAAALVVSGDTGPIHLAAAVGAPIVGLYGPTDPARNGPWDPADVCVSRFAGCACHHRRRCVTGAACVETIAVDEVLRAVDRRLGGAA